ncbi:sugar transferase [Oceanihabitans sediminis]|uniref:Sugar transferase n=1 Tax=Oceanihabitans sediminis TaxID=1812012 RepID=A0A368P4S5_9FLAO|nr:sugar transferase [Oceanihabitans sediminis]MDX1277186.1 sugar transferase [Oceanihabitans sediminis]MDX1773604.1 sugar transferase [Oceanihabitans sediminis]RBP33048.1 lipopolysaccharide/colanic/teichoic acid biosynthesis glycosyltransferase [Oceanihabitans sediminis]RCU57436.1 sugar transferase [Oceanihabitans sediminis]
MTKRLFDICFSLLGLIATSPILLLISILIEIESKGPVFYMQTRVGKNNQDFKIFKFRTMYVGSDKKGLLTLGDKDSRVTKIGYYLRKYKLDELPQLINVLNGSMSFVGPRPEVRKYVDYYTKEYLQILQVKPGITDYASIAFRDEAELLKETKDPEKLYIEEIMPKKIALNKKYISKPSVFTDVKIILKTILTIIK